MSSIFKKDTVIKSFPAYDIVTREKDTNGFVNVSAGDKLHLDYSLFEVGSVVSYALENNRDPIEAYNRAIDLDHNTHWILGLGASLSNTKRDRYKVLDVDFEAVYYFEGHAFTIEKRPNNNLAFVESE